MVLGQQHTHARGGAVCRPRGQQLDLTGTEEAAYLPLGGFDQRLEPGTLLVQDQRDAGRACLGPHRRGEGAGEAQINGGPGSS